jgi:CopG family transcriptional regulator, nickel-responsive regulator
MDRGPQDRLTLIGIVSTSRKAGSRGERLMKDDPLVRFSVAIGGELLRKFDQYREQHRYPNRSEAVRGLMRAALIEETITNDESEAMGVVTLIYDHHVSRIARRLTDLQHHHLDRVVTTTHVHLDEKRCLEVIMLRGPAKEIRDLADDLIGTKGVETGRLVLASAQPVPAHNGAGHSHHHGHGHHDHEH